MTPRVLTCALLGALAVAGPAAAQPGLEVLYGPADAARAIHDGGGGTAGDTGALRQAPIFPDPRWPAARLVGKVAGAELSRLGPADMAARLRAGSADPQVGGLVGLDEVTAADWGRRQSSHLIEALERLGPDARRVVVYVSPGLVVQIGRVDLRHRLEPRLATLLAALRRAGAVELEVYHGDLSPFTRAEFAVSATRWLARWAPADPGQLHLLLGPAVGTTQGDLWLRARSSAAGRQILGNGAGAYGLRSAAEGAEWLGADRAFLADPAAVPPGGDYPVPVGGGLRVSAPRGRMSTVVLPRPARAVLQVIPAGGGRRRVVAKVQGPTPASGVTVRLPADLVPGAYRLVTVALGDGIREVANVGFTVGPRGAER